MGGTASYEFVDAECNAKLLEKSRLKLRATIRVDLLRDAVTRNPFGVHGVRDGDGALIIDWNGLGPACEAINHRQDGFGGGVERKRALPADDVYVQNGEWIVGGKLP